MQGNLFDVRVWMMTSKYNFNNFWCMKYAPVTKTGCQSHALLSLHAIFYFKLVVFGSVWVSP